MALLWGVTGLALSSSAAFLAIRSERGGRGKYASPHQPPANVDWCELFRLSQLANKCNSPPHSIVLDTWFGANFMQRWGRVVVRDVDNVFSRYFIHEGENANGELKQLIGIRGTVTPMNWTKNLQGGLEWDDELCCFLHRGFRSVASAILDDLLLEKSISFLHPSAPAITLVGHSQGGAAAVIVAMKLAARGANIEKVVTFGAPKVTDVAGSLSLWARSISVLRVTLDRDLVPLSPLTLTEKGYAHFGDELRISCGGKHRMRYYEHSIKQKFEDAVQKGCISSHMPGGLELPVSFIRPPTGIFSGPTEEDEQGQGVMSF